MEIHERVLMRIIKQSGGGKGGRENKRGGPMEGGGHLARPCSFFLEIRRSLRKQIVPGFTHCAPKIKGVMRVSLSWGLC